MIAYPNCHETRNKTKPLGIPSNVKGTSSNRPYAAQTRTQI